MIDDGTPIISLPPLLADALSNSRAHIDNWNKALDTAGGGAAEALSSVDEALALLDGRMAASLASTESILARMKNDFGEKSNSGPRNHQRSVHAEVTAATAVAAEANALAADSLAAANTSKGDSRLAAEAGAAVAAADEAAALLAESGGSLADPEVASVGPSKKTKKKGR